jgi:hypothetical protein
MRNPAILHPKKVIAGVLLGTIINSRRDLKLVMLDFNKPLQKLCEQGQSFFSSQGATSR